MTPVSLAPATAAVHAADAPADTAKGGSSDKFEALLDRASGARTDEERGNASNRNAKSVSKDQTPAVRAPARKARGTEPDDTEDESSTPIAEARQQATATTQTGDDVANPTDQTQTDDGSVATACPVATVVPAAAIATQVASGMSASAQPSDEAVTSRETAPVDPRVFSQGDNAATANLTDAAIDESAEGALASQAFPQDAKAEPPKASHPTAMPAIVKSASWAAAATALREALQKSAAAPQESQSAAPQTQAPAATPASQVSSLTAGAATVAALVLPNGRFGLADVSGAEPVHDDAHAAGLGEAVAATVTAALGAGARQQSGGSQSDLRNGSTAGYKVPLKHAGAMPVFTTPAAFARALESAAPPAAPALPPSFTSANLSSVGPQIVKGLQLQVTAGGGDMRLTLTPEHLGTVSIEIRVEHDRVRATLTADTPAVRQWIATHQEDLRQRLDAAGLTLDDLVVREDASQEKQSAEREREAPPKRRAPRSDSEPAFEVVV